MSKDKTKFSGSTKCYTMKEVERNDGRDGVLWLAVDGNVLDVTRFAADHPGGADVLLKHAGQDVTDLFNSIHSIRAKELAKTFMIGRLASAAKKETASSCCGGGSGKKI